MINMEELKSIEEFVKEHPGLAEFKSPVFTAIRAFEAHPWLYHPDYEFRRVAND